MALQKAMQGTAKIKRNSWRGGSGPSSFRGELRGGISKNKKVLNGKVRRRSKGSCRMRIIRESAGQK